MKTFIVFFAATLLVFLAGCEGTDTPINPDASMVTHNGVDSDAMIEVINFSAPLSGHQQVPPVNTRARGLAQFQLINATEMSFELFVANIQNVTAAHIHLGGIGENGPVVVWLYPEEPPPVLIPGMFNGVLATGTITEDDLVGPLEGEPLSELIQNIREINAYVNVHTQQHEAGEIRGQIVIGDGMVR